MVLQPFVLLRRSAFGVAVAVVLGSPSVTSAQGTTFYAHVDYGGDFFGSSTDMSWVGSEWNDQISSVAVPPGSSVTLYEHADFGGMSLTLTSFAPNLLAFSGPGLDGTWNDAVSSLRVTAVATRTVVLVNGSFNAYPPWMDSGAPEFNAIGSTYGVTPLPFRWTDNGFASVTWPHYSGIESGARRFGDMLSAVQSPEVYVITHSHGGNVAIGATQFFTSRRIKRLINLGTPVNWDLRHPATPKADHMCTASSWDDWVQFWGASPYQVSSFMQMSYYGYYYAQKSAEAWLSGNYNDASYYAALASTYMMAGYTWFESTKLEDWGWTVPFNGSHGDMHEPPVWYGLPNACKF